MLKRQEILLVVTYDDTIHDAPAQWAWGTVLDVADEDVQVKGYAEPVEAS